MLEQLAIGNKLDIKSMKKVAPGQKQPIYFSQIIDIENDIRIHITMPMQGTKQIPLEIGERFECVFYASKGLYRGEFVVIERHKEGNLPVIVMEVRTSLSKVQRREFYRFECTIPMKYRYAELDEKIPREDLPKQEWFDGIVLDISGGGLRIVVPEHLKTGDFLQFKLVLQIRGEYKELYLYGNIISSRPKPNNLRLHECRTQFYKVTESDQDLIVSYIFNEERKKRNMTT